MSGAGLWDYALGVYQRPGVEAALLEAQDAHGQCVAYLLWALWLAERGRHADARTLAAGAAAARLWNGAAIAPLRDLRRRLRTPLPSLPAETQLRLREAVQALELEAERTLLETLEAASPAQAEGPGADAAATLAEAVRTWGGEAPAALLARLAKLAL